MMQIVLFIIFNKGLLRNSVAYWNPFSVCLLDHAVLLFSVSLRKGITKHIIFLKGKEKPKIMEPVTLIRQIWLCKVGVQNGL